MQDRLEWKVPWESVCALGLLFLAVLGSQQHGAAASQPAPLRVSPSSAFPGQEISISPACVDHPPPSAHVRIGERWCQPLDDQPLQKPPQACSSRVCKVPLDMPPGYYNLSLASHDVLTDSMPSSAAFRYAEPGSSSAAAYPNAYSLDTLGQLYMLAVHPMVSSISAATGSLAGGQLLMLTGSGFATGNLSANSILLGGTTPCKPETATGTNIICSSSPWITPGRHSTFAGGQGIHLNRWLLSDSSSAGLSGFLSGGKQPERPADLSTELESLYLPAENVTGRKPYMEQLQSIFTPTGTGNHSFYLSASNIAALQLQSVSNSTAARNIINTTTSCSSFFCSREQQSQPQLLVAGQQYLLKVQHLQWDAQTWLGVAATIPSAAVRLDSVQARQQVSFRMPHRQEVQRIIVGSTVSGGAFLLSMGSEAATGQAQTSFSLPIAWNASAAAVQQALKVLPVQLTADQAEGYKGTGWDVTFATAPAAAYPLLTAHNATLACRKHQDCSLRVTRLQAGTLRLHGGFRLGFSSSWTDPLDWDATAVDVQQALATQLALNTSVQRAVVTVDMPAFNVTFTGHPGPISLLKVDASSLSVGMADSDTNSSVDTVIQGSADRFLAPIPSHYLRTPHDKPQVQVSVNGMTAACASAAGGCPYAAEAEATPVITRVQETQANAGLHRSLAIFGSHFGPDSKVTVADEDCIITSATSSILACQLPAHGRAGNSTVQIRSSLGLAEHQGDGAPFQIAYPLAIDDVIHKGLALGGGATVTLQGSGFGSTPDGVSLSIGNASIPVVGVAPQLISLTAPPAAAVQLQPKKLSTTGTLTVNGESASFTLTYSAAATPVLGTVRAVGSGAGAGPAVISAAGAVQLQVEGANFGLSPEVTMGGQPCSVDHANDTVIVCSAAPAAAAGWAAVHVTRPAQGCDADGVTLATAFQVTSVEPAAVGTTGGATIHIHGIGFPTSPHLMPAVQLDTSNMTCSVTAANATFIACFTQLMAPIHPTLPSATITVQSGSATAGCSSQAWWLSKAAIAHNKAVQQNESACQISIAPAAAMNATAVSPTVLLSGYATHISLQQPSSVPGSSLNVSLWPLDALPMASDHSKPTQQPGRFPDFMGSFSAFMALPQCTIMEDNATVVTCSIPSDLAAGVYRIVTWSSAWGFARGQPVVTVVPSMTAVTPSQGSMAGAELLIRGSGFGGNARSVTVMLGSSACLVLTVNASAISCRGLPAAAEGPVHVQVSVAASSLSPTASIPAKDMCTCTEPSSAQPCCSFSHAEHLTTDVTYGRAIVNDSGSASFTVRYGSPVSAASGRVELGTPAGVLAADLQTVAANEVLAVAPSLSAGIWHVQSSVRSQGYTRDQQPLNITVPLLVTGTTPQSGSCAGGTLLLVSGSGFGTTSQDLRATVCEVPCAVTWASNTLLACTTGSAQQLCMNKDSDCNVTVSTARAQAQQPGGWTYSRALTPTVAIMHPLHGPMSGGTVVTLQGHGLVSEFASAPALTDSLLSTAEQLGTAAQALSSLLTNAAVVAVSHQGLPCQLLTVNATVLTCRTAAVAENGAYDPAAGTAVTVARSGSAAIAGPSFAYVTAWSHADTWPGGAVPQAGDAVTIGQDQSILLDISSPPLRQLRIHGRLLAKDAEDLQLQVGSILISGQQAAFRMGSPDQPLQHGARIVMTGTAWTNTGERRYPPGGLVVEQGLLSLHGQSAEPHITQLTQSAHAGDSIIAVKGTISWQVNSTIALTPTSPGADAERCIVAGVTPDSGSNTAVVRVQQPLQQDHVGGRLLMHGLQVDMQTRVMLLHRSIQILDSSGSQPYISVGGQNAAIVQMSNVQCSSCGQGPPVNQPAVHITATAAPGSYLRRVVLHDSASRGLQVDTAAAFAAEQSIVLNTSGHGMAVGDTAAGSADVPSAEPVVRLHGNTVVDVHATSAGQPSDAVPAAFWVSATGGDLRDNVALGSEGHGFRIQSSSSTLTCQLPVAASFQDNAAHSNQGHGLLMDPPCEAANLDSKDLPGVSMLIDSYQAYHNGQMGLSVRGFCSTVLRNSTLAGNRQGGAQVLPATVEGTVVLLEGSKIIAPAQERATAANDVTQALHNEAGAQNMAATAPVVGWWLAGQNTNQTIRNTILAGFASPDSAAIAAPQHSAAGSLAFVNTANVSLLGPQGLHLNAGNESQVVVLAADGSLTGFQPGGIVTPVLQHLAGLCSFSSGWLHSLVCPLAAVAGLARLTLSAAEPVHGSEAAQQLQAALSLDGLANSTLVHSLRTGKQEDWAVPVPLNRSFTLTLPALHAVDITLDLPEHSMSGDVQLRVHLAAAAGMQVVVTDRNAGRGGTDPGQKQRWQLSSAGSSGSTLSIATSAAALLQQRLALHLALVPDAPQLAAPAPAASPPLPEPFLRTWSNVSQWPEGVVPARGAHVTVPASWRLILDESPAVLASLSIAGQLLFSNNRPSTLLQAGSIAILPGGVLQAGSPSQPYMQQALIQLLPAPGSGLQLPGQGLRVQGSLQLHGAPSLPSWTWLAATAAAGSSELQLATVVDWAVGDTLVVAPSSFHASEAEQAVIKSIRGSVVKLENKLDFEHYGAARPAVVGGKQVELRAAVGRLIRSIRVTASAAAGISVGAITSESTANVSLSHVEMAGLGLLAPPSAAFTAAGGAIELQGCSLHDSLGSSVALSGTAGARLVDNVIVASRGSSISLERSTAAWLEGNLAVGSASQTLNISRAVYEPVANYALCHHAANVLPGLLGSTELSCSTATVLNNIAAGSQHFGFIMQGGACSSEPATVAAGNVAHSSRVGFWLAEAGGSCTALGNLTAHHTTEVAVHFNRPAQQLLISNVTLSDNRIGLAVLPACEDLSDESSPYHNPQQEGRVPPQRSGPLQLAASAPATGSRRCSIAVSDAVLIGSSDNAACSKACNAEAADRQLPDPLAADAEGGCGTRIGILAGVFDPFVKPFPRRQPWMTYHQVIGDSAFGGSVSMRNLTAANWSASTACGSGHAVVAANPTSLDLTPPHQINQVVLQNASSQALVRMYNASLRQAGLQQALISDMDGSFLGKPAQVLAADAPQAAAQGCKLQAAGGAVACSGQMWGQLNVEADGGSERFGSAAAQLVVAGGNSTSLLLDPFLDHRWDNGRASGLRRLRWAALLQLNGSYSLTFMGAMPQTLRLAIAGSVSAAEGLRLTIPYGNLTALRITADGMVLPASQIPIGYAARAAWTFSAGSHSLTLAVPAAAGSVTIEQLHAVHAQLSMGAGSMGPGRGAALSIGQAVAAVLEVPAATVQLWNSSDGSEVTDRAAFQGQAQLLVTEVDASSEQQPSRHSRHALARVLQALQAAADSMETSVGLSLHLLNVTVLAASEPWRRLAACVPSCKTINGREAICVEGQCLCTSHGQQYQSQLSAGSLYSNITSPTSQMDVAQSIEGCKWVNAPPAPPPRPPPAPPFASLQLQGALPKTPPVPSAPGQKPLAAPLQPPTDPTALSPPPYAPPGFTAAAPAPQGSRAPAPAPHAQLQAVISLDGQKPPAAAPLLVTAASFNVTVQFSDSMGSKRVRVLGLHASAVVVQTQPAEAPVKLQGSAGSANQSASTFQLSMTHNNSLSWGSACSGPLPLVLHLPAAATRSEAGLPNGPSNRLYVNWYPLSLAACSAQIAPPPPGSPPAPPLSSPSALTFSTMLPHLDLTQFQDQEFAAGFVAAFQQQVAQAAHVAPADVHILSIGQSSSAVQAAVVFPSTPEAELSRQSFHQTLVNNASDIFSSSAFVSSYGIPQVALLSPPGPPPPVPYAPPQAPPTPQAPTPARYLPLAAARRPGSHAPIGTLVALPTSLAAVCGAVGTAAAWLWLLRRRRRRQLQEGGHAEHAHIVTPMSAQPDSRTRRFLAQVNTALPGLSWAAVRRQPGYGPVTPSRARQPAHHPSRTRSNPLGRSLPQGGSSLSPG